MHQMLGMLWNISGTTTIIGCDNAMKSEIDLEAYLAKLSATIIGCDNAMKSEIDLEAYLAKLSELRANQDTRTVEELSHDMHQLLGMIWNISGTKKMRAAIELNDRMDTSQYSEAIRKLRQEIHPLEEVLLNFNIPDNINCYFKRVGSYADGTQMMGSDQDILIILNSNLLSEKEKEVNSDLYVCLNRGPLTPNGYTKMQIHWNGKTCNVDDFKQQYYHHFLHEIHVENEQHVFLTNCIREKHMLNISKVFEHGPALAIKEEFSYRDGVPAYECEAIPHDMGPWFDRPRPNNWPSKTTRDLFKSMGCCYVPVGHSKSAEKDIEWRISPTRQELHLMLNLNQTQYRCFLLLKILKSNITFFCGDYISSYHCKTALFYTIENNSSCIWEPRLLYDCFGECVKLLLKWVGEEKCPNYFIPEENMFETKIVDNNQKKRIQQLLFGYSTLYDLPKLNKSFFDYLGLGNPKHKNDLLVRRAFDLRNIVMDLENDLNISVSQLADKRLKIEQNIELIKTNRAHAQLLFKKMVSPYEIDVTILLEVLKKRLFYLDRTVYLNLLMEKALYSKKEVYEHLPDMSRKTPEDFEFYLKLATITSAQGDLNTCDSLLQKIHSMGYKVNVICQCSMCSFKEINKTGVSNEPLFSLEEICSDQISVQDILQYFSSISCLEFAYPYIETCVPMPMHFEAHREVGMELHFGSDTQVNYDVFNRKDHYYSMAIHHTAYMHFLQYKNSEMMNEKSDTCVALERLENMNLVSLQRGIYVHPDTTLNILGHIYITKGWYILAIQCFRRSWQLASHYNAAKVHVMFMLFGNLAKYEIIYRRTRTGTDL